MNSKGLYTAAAALIAVIILSSAVLYAQGESKSTITESSNAIFKVRATWQNARYLFDKATADAFSDAVRETCPVINSGNVKQKMNDYYLVVSDTITEKTGVGCTAIIDSVQISSNNLTANIELTCKINTTEYSKSIKYEKEITVLYAISPCTVQVRDLQSHELEVTS